MAAPPLVFNFLGVVFMAILYGLYCMIFALYWQIRLGRARPSPWKGVLLYALTANFILCTAYLIVTMVQVQFFITMAVLNEDSLGPPTLWLSITADALYTAIDFISQLILFYRCWIVWGQLLVMVLPCILSLAFLVIASTTLGLQIKITANNLNSPLPDWYLSAVTAFFFMSLAVNALGTALIIYKIIKVYDDLKGFKPSIAQASLTRKTNRDGHRDLYLLVSILIESGLITLVAQLIQSIMYKSANDAFALVGGSVVMLYGISSTVVLVRVDRGIAYDQNTLKSSTNLEGPIQFTNSLQRPIDVVESDSLNDPHGSDRKFIRHN